jgi:membrane protease YdiL (CAAX protease family)
MPDLSAPRENIYRQPIDAAQFGVVAKPLSPWERIYNLAGVRKPVILIALAAAWEIYARWLNNPLLEIPSVFAGLLTVIVIGLLVENVIFRTVEVRTVRRWGMQS